MQKFEPYCSSGNSLCLNNRRAQESDSDDFSSSLSFFIYIYAIIDIFHCDFVHNCLMCVNSGVAAPLERVISIGQWDFCY